MKKLALIMGYAAAGLFSGIIQAENKTKPTRRPLPRATRNVETPQYQILARKWDPKKEDWFVQFQKNGNVVTFRKSKEIPTSAKRMGNNQYLEHAQSWKYPENGKGDFVWVSKSQLKKVIRAAIDDKSIHPDYPLEKWHAVSIKTRGRNTVIIDKEVVKLLAENFLSTGHMFGPKSGKDNRVKKENLEKKKESKSEHA